jgi:hypothetical protein
MHGTEKHFCRSETPVGTRFPTKHCVTAESMKSLARDSQDMTRQVQNPSSQMLPAVSRR